MATASHRKPELMAPLDVIFAKNGQLEAGHQTMLSGATDAASNLLKNILFLVSSSTVVFFASGMSPKKT